MYIWLTETDTYSRSERRVQCSRIPESSSTSSRVSLHWLSLETQAKNKDITAAPTVSLVTFYCTHTQPHLQTMNFLVTLCRKTEIALTCRWCTLLSPPQTWWRLLLGAWETHIFITLCQMPMYVQRQVADTNTLLCNNALVEGYLACSCVWRSRHPRANYMLICWSEKE